MPWLKLVLVQDDDKDDNKDDGKDDNKNDDKDDGNCQATHSSLKCKPKAKSGIASCASQL